MEKTFNITVANYSRITQKRIILDKEWGTEEYYTVKDDGEKLVIKKCYMEIPKRAFKIGRYNDLPIEHSDIPNGEYSFDQDESNTDIAVIYYREQLPQYKN